MSPTGRMIWRLFGGFYFSLNKTGVTSYLREGISGIDGDR